MGITVEARKRVSTCVKPLQSFSGQSVTAASSATLTVLFSYCQQRLHKVSKKPHKNLCNHSSKKVRKTLFSSALKSRFEDMPFKKMAIIRLQQDWRLLAFYYWQKVTNQWYMIRRDDFSIQAFENVYTNKQEKPQTSYKSVTQGFGSFIKAPLL